MRTHLGTARQADAAALHTRGAHLAKAAQTVRQSRKMFGCGTATAAEHLRAHMGKRSCLAGEVLRPQREYRLRSPQLGQAGIRLGHDRAGAHAQKFGNLRLHLFRPEAALLPTKFHGRDWMVFGTCGGTDYPELSLPEP